MPAASCTLALALGGDLVGDGLALLGHVSSNGLALGRHVGDDLLALGSSLLVDLLGVGACLGAPLLGLAPDAVGLVGHHGAGLLAGTRRAQQRGDGTHQAAKDEHSELIGHNCLLNRADRCAPL